VVRDVVARRVATTMRRTIMLLYDDGEAAGEKHRVKQWRRSFEPSLLLLTLLIPTYKSCVV
jgi:hypothetical protein